MIKSKSDFFKNVLATAAVVGTLTTGSNVASAFDVVRSESLDALTPAGLIPFLQPAGTWRNNYDLTYTVGVGPDVGPKTVNAATAAGGVLAIRDIMVNGQVGSTLQTNVGQPITIRSIDDLVGGGSFAITGDGSVLVTNKIGAAGKLGDFTVTGNGLRFFTQTIQSIGNVDITGGNYLLTFANNGVNAGGNINIVSGAGGITLGGGLINADGNLDLDCTNANVASLNGNNTNITAINIVRITGATTATPLNLGDILGQNIILSAGDAGNITVTEAKSTQAILINGNGAASTTTITGITSANTLVISDASNANLTGNITAKVGGITVLGDGARTFGAIVSQANVKITGGIGLLTFANNGVTTTAGNISIISGAGGVILGGGAITSAADLILDGTNAVGGTLTANDTNLDAVGGITVIGAMNAANWDLGNITSRGAFTLTTSGGGNIAAKNVIADNGATLNLMKAGAVTFDSFRAIGGATLSLGDVTTNITSANPFVLGGALVINTTVNKAGDAGQLRITGDFDGGAVAGTTINIDDAAAPEANATKVILSSTGAYTAIGGAINVPPTLRVNVLTWTATENAAAKTLSITSRVNAPAVVAGSGLAFIEGGPSSDELRDEALGGNKTVLNEIQFLANVAPSSLSEAKESLREDPEVTGAMMQASSIAVGSAISNVNSRLDAVLGSALGSSAPSVAPRMESMTSSAQSVSAVSSSAVYSSASSSSSSDTAILMPDSPSSGSSTSTVEGSRSDGAKSKSSSSAPASSGAKGSGKNKETKEGQNSGDEIVELGAWVSGFGGQAVQKPKGGETGYRTKVYGGSIGIDTSLCENLTAGLAFTQAEANVYHKGLARGNKTKAQISALSAYGFYDFENNWFTRAILTYAQSSITNHEKRPDVIAKRDGSVSYAVATAKYKSKVGNADLTGGYRHIIEGSTSITPTLGLSYAQYYDNGYTETGVKFATNDQNKTVKKKRYNQFNGTIGASLGTRTEMEGVIFTPEIHGFLTQVLGGKKAKIVSTAPGMYGTNSNTYKPAKTTWTLGLSGAIKSGMTEFGLGYDATIAKKYIGHQGSFKVRVNF